MDSAAVAGGAGQSSRRVVPMIQQLNPISYTTPTPNYYNNVPRSGMPALPNNNIMYNNFTSFNPHLYNNNAVAGGMIDSNSHQLYLMNAMLWHDNNT